MAATGDREDQSDSKGYNGTREHQEEENTMEADEVAKRNKDFKMQTLHDLTIERKNELTPEMWNKSCRKSDEVAREYMEVDDMNNEEEIEDDDDDEESSENNESGTENNEGGHSDSDSVI